MTTEPEYTMQFLFPLSSIRQIVSEMFYEFKQEFTKSGSENHHTAFNWKRLETFQKRR